MVITTADKAYLIASIDTEVARVRRAMNATNNQSIREILNSNVSDLLELQSRVSRESTKEVVK